MRIDGDRFSSLLNQEPLPVYIIYGDDPLLPLEAMDRLRRFLQAKGFSERVVLTVLPGFDWQALTETGGNRSLFGDRQLIELRISNGKPGKEGSSAITAHVNKYQQAKDLVLLIHLGTLDWREEKASWLENLSKIGAIVRFKAPTLSQLPGWIAQRLKQQQQTTSTEGLHFIAERVEGNLLAAHQEILKLALLYPAGSIDLQQIKEAVLDVARYDLDSLRDAFLRADISRYARTLSGLVNEGEAPPLLLWAISEEVKTLVQIQSSIAAGQSQSAALKEAKVWGIRQQAINQALQRLSSARCQAMLQECARIDRLIKGIGQEDTSNALLRLGFMCANV